ncbi:hypothetical protein HB364_21540 [Pseudoflavitalea sp. X16]|uniref:hypothetical protein n=1 Tax=Paraflavitalea devenefica TaxID=2716334 RepID=UPI001423583C|nr:hypothetical protein [Paraflavitalea devenefica]NII27681.1 hypothetical protein [Paraflavitalea devenefica]
MLRDICLSFSSSGNPKSTDKLFWDSLFIGALFLRHLGHIKAGKCQKITIKAVDKLELQIEDYENIASINVVTYFKLFDYEEFQALNREDKKYKLLDFLYAGMEELFLLKQWDAAPLQPAYEACKMDDIVFRKYLEKAIKDPINKTIAYQVFFTWEWEEVQCYLIKWDTKNKIELSRSLYFKTKPNTFEQRWDFRLDKEARQFVLESKVFKNRYELPLQIVS